MTNQANLQRAAAGSEVTVRVDPSALGPVEVRAQLGGAGLDVHLHAQRAGTSQALHDALPALRAELEASGIGTRVLAAHRTDLGNANTNAGGSGAGRSDRDGANGSNPGSPAGGGTADSTGGRQADQREGQTGHDARHLGRPTPSGAGLTNAAGPTDATANRAVRSEATTATTAHDRRIDLQL